MSHVASTYAAVMAIVNIASDKAYEIIDLPGMKKYLISVKNNYKATDNSKSHYGYV